MKHLRQEGGWFQCSQNSPVVLLVHENATGQHGENAWVLFEILLFLQLTDLEDQTLVYVLLANMVHGFMEIVHLGNHKMMGSGGKLEGSRDAVRDFSVENLISMVILQG